MAMNGPWRQDFSTSDGQGKKNICFMLRYESCIYFNTIWIIKLGEHKKIEVRRNLQSDLSIVKWVDSKAKPI